MKQWDTLSNTDIEISSKYLALAFSGGGSKGAYIIGALKKLDDVNNVLSRTRVVYGTSTGALIAAKIGAHLADPLGGHLEELETIYRSVETDNILHPHIESDSLWKMIYNREIFKIFKVPSLCDSKPLLDLIEHHVDDKIWQAIVNLGNKIYDPIEIGFVVTSASTGHPRVITNRTHRDPKVLKKAVLASASIPILMPAVDVFDDGTKYVDGCLAAFNPVDLIHYSEFSSDINKAIAISTSDYEGSGLTMLNDLLFLIGKRIGFTAPGSTVRIIRILNRLGMGSSFIPPFVTKWLDNKNKVKEILRIPVQESKFTVLHYHPKSPLLSNPFVFKQPEMSKMIDHAYEETVSLHYPSKIRQII